MRKYAKKAAAVLLLLLVLCAVLWRLWPRTLGGVIGVEEDAVLRLTCASSSMGLKETGDLFTDQYQLPEQAKGSGDFNGVMEILKESGYRPDFRNLLPWGISSVISHGGSGKSASVILVWGSTAGDACALDIQSGGKVVVSTWEGDGLLIYHPTDSSLPERLAGYIQEHGVKSGKELSGQELSGV